MAAVTGITLNWEFTYRGDATEEWGNTFHFRGAPPGDAASWHVLTQDLIGHMQPCVSARCKVSSAWGYDSDDPTAHAVWSYDYILNGENNVGTFAPGPQDLQSAGDQAAMLWVLTDKKNTRGKPIYLRKYLHDCYHDRDAPDQLSPLYKAALTTFCNTLAGGAGVFHGGLRAQRYDHTNITNDVDRFITTRTLHRRGKRPVPKA